MMRIGQRIDEVSLKRHDRRRAWGTIRHFGFELVLVALLLATAVAVRCQDMFLIRTIDVKPGSSMYVPRYYGDEAHAGKSTVRTDPQHPLAWRCTIRPVYAYPYCGYELLFDAKSPNIGLDLSQLESLTISLDYTGPFDTFRIYLKNYDRRYSKPDLPDTLKFNKVEVSAVPGRNYVTLKPSDFAVAEWWVTQNKIKPALSHTQLDNVTELQFQTGTQAPPAVYTFRVHDIVLKTRRISQATWYGALLAAWTVLICLYLGHRILRLRADLAQRRESQAAALRLAQYAEESARRDYLTKLLNRSGVIDLYHPMAMSRRGDGAFAVILLDVDHFKSVNDRFGHSAGDQVLAGIASILTSNTRAGDIVGRWGGEEFLLICNVTDQEAAVAIAGKLRAAIETHEFQTVGKVTASLGVYCCGGQAEALEHLVSHADAALYAAKEQGRNRIVMYQPFMREAA